MNKEKSVWWIAKPSGSSQGKGIIITNNLNDVSKTNIVLSQTYLLQILKQNQQSYIASHYIMNPLLINGFKFDLRIYVAITSINPLRIYVYEEGLARFSTVKYNTSEDQKANK